MTWQHEVFGPMLERTLENAQVHCLATRYDLSRDSRLARAIVTKVNTALDTEERRRGVQRVHTGELLIRTGRGPLVLPLRTPELLQRVIDGERWDRVRRDILTESADRYRQLFPDAHPQDVRDFLRALYPGRMPRTAGTHPAVGPRRTRPWGSTIPGGTPAPELDLARAERRTQRGPPRPAHEQDTLMALTRYLGTEAGIPPAVQEPMLLELSALRARFHPRVGMLASGHMPLAAMHADAGRNLWRASRDQPLAPITISVLQGGYSRRFRPPIPRESGH
ncbi:MAG: hypothetical protein U5K81_06940 [Trueperaceae bacterium]|nr:hypothetical protein [Trueperaceae bacterium]